MTDRKRILVSISFFPELVARLREFADVDCVDDVPFKHAGEVAERAAPCDGMVIASWPPVDAALLDKAPKLKVVASMAVGFNNIDVPACTARGVLATNAPDVLTETTADFGFALMMAAARRITESERYLREGRWKGWRYDMLAGQDVHGATLGILGMGRIGGAIARRGAHGFGMKVIYHNRSRLPDGQEAELKARYVDKQTLLRESDHLVLVVPYSPASHHAIGAAEIALMKPTATLTNIARGGVVDDAALIEALRARRIAAAGVDVFEGEPKFNPGFLELDNVVLTPHIASASLPTRQAMAGLAVRNVLAGLGLGPDAGRPVTPLNPEVLRG